MIESSDIILYPEELSDIYGCIEKKLRKKIGTCSKEKGYIVDIEEIDKTTIKNIVSRNSGNCIFTVSYKIITLKPEIDHDYSVLVNCIFKEGIFCEYKNIKILIPTSELHNYIFHNSKFINAEIKHTIQVGDTICVKIKNVRYDDQNYQCIGTILNTDK